MDTEAQDLKVRENRLRRAAARQGLFLSRRRRRDTNALDFGRYALFRGSLAGEPVAGVGYGGVYGLTLADVEAILAAGEAKPTDPPSTQPQNTEPQSTTPPVEKPASPHPAPPLVPRRRGIGARTPRRGR